MREMKGISRADFEMGVWEEMSCSDKKKVEKNIWEWGDERREERKNVPGTLKEDT